jgi:molybdopterin/thiamine biosynthesis adenylyltransferase
MNTTAYIEATERHRDMLTVEQQLRLRAASVAVIGAGGIGGIAALLCAKAGIGRISICDFDAYEVVNIVEQEFANYDTVGKTKVAVAAEVLRKHGHGCTVTAHDRKIETVEDALAVMEGATCVFSGVDNARAKILTDRAANSLGIPVFLAANLGWFVQHLAYMPGPHRYETMYRDVPGLPELSDDALHLADIHHLVYFTFFGRFDVGYFRDLLTGKADHLRYMATQAYMIAALAVNDLIKFVTGRGPIVTYPDAVFAFDTLVERQYSESEYRQLCAAVSEITMAAASGEIDAACKLFRDRVRWLPAVNTESNGAPLSKAEAEDCGANA